MELEQVLFAGAQALAEKIEGPSSQMIERLSSDPDRPLTLKQEVVQKLKVEQVNKSLTVIPVDYWVISCCQ